MKKGLCSQSEIALHTHDSISYKRCRRKWMLSSPFRMHLQPKASVFGANPHLWFGSGFHFGLEDRFGYNRFGKASEAFLAYVAAHEPEELPENVEELKELGVAMLDFYEGWEEKIGKWRTVWVDGKPLVEVKFSLVLEPLTHYILNNHQYYRVEDSDNWMCKESDHVLSENLLIQYGAEKKEIVFHGTLDRVVEDSKGNWWILDYKTAKAIDTSKLDLDPQISKYCWAAEQWFDREIAGMVYVQCTKNPPKAPKLTTKGVSADKRQRTTHALYKAALIEYYGSVQAAPAANVALLNDLADRETENGNEFIRYDFVPRNEVSKRNVYEHILAEGREILNPDLPIYPNPTRDCSWDCPFKVICIAMEEGADWECYLDDFEVRAETMKDEIRAWERRLYKKNKEKYPEEYDKYCKEGTDTLEDFLKDLEEV